jgi:hypothetical protein
VDRLSAQRALWRQLINSIKLVKQTSEPAPPGLIRPVLQVETCDPAKLPLIVGNQHQFASQRLGGDERSWKVDDRFAYLVQPRSAALSGQSLIRDPPRHSSALSSGNEPRRVMTKLERRRGLADVLKMPRSRPKFSVKRPNRDNWRVERSRNTKNHKMPH